MRLSRSFTVSPEDPCLPGHFPGAPVVPGVLILEEVMRAATGRNVRACWPKVKFINSVSPGEQVDVYLDPLSRTIRFECRVAERVVAAGSFEPMQEQTA